jgi:hypothetical protein
MPRESQQDRAQLTVESTLIYLQQIAQVSISAKLNSDQLKHCLQRLETCFKQRRGVLLRSSLMEVLSQMKTCLKMDQLNQNQLDHLFSQLQRHLVMLKLINPDYPPIFNLNPSQPTNNEVEIIEPTSSASESAQSSTPPSSAPSMLAPLASAPSSSAPPSLTPPSSAPSMSAPSASAPP